MIENLPSRFAKCTFETYPVSDATQAGLDAIRYWATDGAELRNSLFIHGRPGVGKTGLACAVLNQWDRNGCDPAVFWSTAGLLDELRRSYRPGDNFRQDDDEPGPLEWVQTVSNLVLDDFGIENASDWTAATLFGIVDRRYSDDAVTIFTSNYSLPELKDRIARQVDARGGRRRTASREGLTVAERIIGRIGEMAEVVFLDGPDLRDPVERAGIDAVAAAQDVIKGKGRRA